MKDHSQYGETQIIADAVAAIEKQGLTVPRVAVEFGAGDGFALSNIRGLMEDGWMGVQLEKEPSVNSVKRFDVTTRNVNEILFFVANHEIGVFSIDVDGNDYWIWKAMTFRPVIVCIEYNPTLSGKKTIKYDPMHRWTGTDSYCGASFQAIIDLGHSLDMKVVVA